MPRLRERWIGYPAAALLVAATVALLKLFPRLADSSIALLLLLSVFLAAWAWESGPGVLAALLATTAFNFFFIRPLYTFIVEDPHNVTALLVFLVSALLIGRLSAIARLRLRLVESERRDLTALTRLSQAFLADTNREALLGVAVDRLREALQAARVAIWLVDQQGEPYEAAASPETQARKDVVDLAYRQGNSAAFPSVLGGTDLYLPIPVGIHRAGVLVVRGLQSSDRMAEGCAILLGLALERERFVRLARTAEEIQASEQMKSTLLAAVAHDLKTPITAALGALENWQARAGGSEEARLAHEELERLSRNVSDLLEVVRLDSGAARPRREVVTGGEIVEAAVARFGGALAAHTLFVDVPAREAAVEVDPGQVTEALGHGLENAARYSPPGTEIRVSASADEKTVSLRVSDRGRGIPAADRERVFERFVRLGNDADVPGTGLGLSIARSLVAMNGGELTIGAAQGGGTLFQIALPRAE